HLPGIQRGRSRDLSGRARARRRHRLRNVLHCVNAQTRRRCSAIYSIAKCCICEAQSCLTERFQAGASSRPLSIHAVRQGFLAYYDGCTPSGIRQLACHNKLVPTDERQYYMSSYFQVLFPIYFLWRLWILAFRCMGGPDSAETFSIALRKSQDNQC